MGFLRDLENHLRPNIPQRMCLECQTPMQYRGDHAIRTGGMPGGPVGVTIDGIIGPANESFANEGFEKNVRVRVFVCPTCGDLRLVNDPNHGF